MKQRIVELSIQLFESKGFSEASIQDVVDALGVTKGTFYYYFDSKEQLLMDIHSKYIDELLTLQETILDEPKSYKHKLFDMVGLLIKQIKTHGHMARVFFREMRNLNEDNVKIIRKKREDFRLNLQKIIELGIETGEFRKDLKADMITFGILGMCNWSYNWFNPEGPVSDQELIESYIEMVLHGIC